MASTDLPYQQWSWQANPTQAATAVDRVYAALSSDIVDGTLPAGSLITEGEIALAHKVSRTPVREAFLLLQAQGLLQLFPKKGAVVTVTNPTETAQLLQVRVMLESSAVELQHSGATPDPSISADLASIIDQQRQAAASTDIPAFARVDHQFHARVVAGSGNPLIVGFYNQLGPRLARLTCQTVNRKPAQLVGFIDQHAQLSRFLEAGDYRAYENLLRSHIAQ